MKWFRSIAALLTLALVGCAAPSGQAPQGQWVYPPMAIPLQPSLQQEVQIARLTQLLQRSDLEDDVRAKMLYERGNYYDSVGLRDLARLDFNQSLQINPAQPDIFNLLGVYFTQVGEFDAAFDAFDAALELAPDNIYAERNRAIALYYGGRQTLALEAIRAHFVQDEQDPFRALWLYIIEAKDQPEQARKDLLELYQHKDEQWGWVLVAMMLDEVTEEDAFRAIIAGSRENELLAQRLTEAYFYLGKRHQMANDFASAISLYKLAVSFNVYEYIEHRYAFLELAVIYRQLQAERAATENADGL
ncbi:lipoprotein NlpI [Vibrio sp. SM6]|uniref:Lipoprotein NlpI n=1 Tax=Vibrio agarilyticus TaxID=2726741 RepID=A0A7X8TQ65_9VIBR|nr:lipoprotein NlpI [Vibrio agarilyticus]